MVRCGATGRFKRCLARMAYASEGFAGVVFGGEADGGKAMKLVGKGG